MKYTNQSTKKQKITYTITTEGLKKAEQAFARIGFDSKSNFAKSILMSCSTVTKFFDLKPIQLDSWQKICQELKLSNWEEIAVINKKERLRLLEINAGNSRNLKEEGENIQISNKREDDRKTLPKIFNKWHLVAEIANHPVVSRSLENVDLSDTDLSHSDLSRADLRGADLSCADLSRTDLRGAYLNGANLSCADLRGAYLNGANLSCAYLRSVNLSNANLSNADLSKAYLNNSNLKYSDLFSAKLIDTNLRNANLSNAYLRNVNLSNANLSSSNLSGTNLIDAYLGSTNLSNTAVENTRFGHNLGISEAMKRNLIARGAIFEDSPGARSKVWRC